VESGTGGLNPSPTSLVLLVRQVMLSHEDDAVAIMPPPRRSHTTCGDSPPWRFQPDANRDSNSSAAPSIVPTVMAAP